MLFIFVHLPLFQIQGAIILASVIQVLVGFSGVIGLLLRFIGPITIAVTISMVGISLYDVAANSCGQHWWISLM